MKITRIISHVLSYDMSEILGYSQQRYAKRAAHPVGIQSDERAASCGENFGPRTIAIASKEIVEKVVQPMALAMNPMDRDVIWHKVYNLLRYWGQKIMPILSLSGVNIALGDIAGKVADLPLHKLIGGVHRVDVPCQEYGKMLRSAPVEDLAARLEDEAAAIKGRGFTDTKMKTGHGPKPDLKLCETVQRGLGDDFRYIVDTHHCITPSDVFYVGPRLQELDAYWVDKPIETEDLEGNHELRAGLNVNISGRDAEFNLFDWRNCRRDQLSTSRSYAAVAQWTAPSGAYVGVRYHRKQIPRQSLGRHLEHIPRQVKANEGRVRTPTAQGIGLDPDRDFIEHNSIDA